VSTVFNVYEDVNFLDEIFYSFYVRIFRTGTAGEMKVL